MAKPASSTKVAVPSSVVSNSTVGGEYGPTTRSDTLWEIALKARPDRSVSPQQVMLAIQDMNPNAFMNGNINRLKTGQVLRLPDLEQIQQRSLSQAIQEVISQNEALDPTKRKRTVSVSPDLSDKATASDSVRATVPQDKLKLVVANEGDETEAKSSAGNVKNAGGGDQVGDERLALAMEQLDKSQSENVELNNRLSDLEEQLETLQRLLTLKNDQLANIQAQNQAQELSAAEKAEQAPEATTEQASQMLEAASTEEASADETATEDASLNEESSDPAAEANEQAEVADGTVEEGAANESPVTEDQGIAEESNVAANQTAAPEKAETMSAADLKPPVAPAAKPQTFASVIENILATPLYLGGIVAVLILLLVILWLVSRSNARKEEQLFAQENRFDEVDEPNFDAPQEAVVEETSFDEVEEYEQSLEEAFEPEELDEFESALDLEDDESVYDEDPTPVEAEEAPAVNEHPTEARNAIEEAEAYIVYGRYDQALTVLASGIEEEPLRADYRLRMLELYCELEDVDNFDKHYNELGALQNAEATEQADVIKARLAENVFNKKSEDEVEPFAEADEEVSNSFELDTVEEVDEDLDVDLGDDDLDIDLDIDLDLDESSSESETTAPNFNVDFSDVELDADLDGEKEIDLVAPESLTPSLGDTVDETSDSELVDPIDAEESEVLDVDLGDSSDESVEDSHDEVDEDSSEESAGFNSDDLLNEEDSEAAEDASAPAEESLGAIDDFDFLNGTDEASTKLDLARAYIDMGDTDGARDILLEVEKEGSPEQQTEARNLIDSL